MFRAVSRTVLLVCGCIGFAVSLITLHAEDVESMDYRFRTEITAAEGRWAMKFGYFHISSHVGDEYMLRNPLFQRTNYVTESWMLGLRYAATDSIQLYGEMANAFPTSGGAKRYQYQTGIEYTPIVSPTRTGAPFVAVNLNFREAVDYDVSPTIQLGWAFQGPESHRRFRVGLQYAEGPTSQYEFFTRREEYIGVGVWFDYQSGRHPLLPGYRNGVNFVSCGIRAPEKPLKLENRRKPSTSRNSSKPQDRLGVLWMCRVCARHFPHSLSPAEASFRGAVFNTPK